MVTKMRMALMLIILILPTCLGISTDRVTLNKPYLFDLFELHVTEGTELDLVVVLLCFVYFLLVETYILAGNKKERCVRERTVDRRGTLKNELGSHQSRNTATDTTMTENQSMTDDGWFIVLPAKREWTACRTVSKTTSSPLWIKGIEC